MRRMYITLRKKAVKGFRCMIRVRRKKDKKVLTAAVCPGCWNSSRLRISLMEQMKELGVEVVSRKDHIDGDLYGMGKHLRDCPEKHSKC